MKKVQSLGLLIAFLLVSFACVREPVSGPIITPTSRSAAEPSQKTWQERWESTVAAAKKEGTVNFTTDVSPDVINGLRSGFEKKFGIELQISSMRGAEFSGKIAAERRAGLYMWDVYSHGPTTTILTLKPGGFIVPLEPALILPEVTDPKAWRGGRLPFLDKDGMALGYIALFYRGALINTDMVKEGQLKSFYDLLKPEWKGKIVTDNLALPGPGNLLVTLMAVAFDNDLDKLREYLSGLVKQEPVVVRDYRTTAEWVARGKYPILLGYDTGMAADFKSKGAPITLAPMKEGSFVGSRGPQTLTLPSGPLPHPNAAVVFINWLLSREGQAIYVKAYGAAPSFRVDVSPAGIDPVFLEQPGEKLIFEDENTSQLSGKLLPIAREIFAPLLK